MRKLFYIIFFVVALAFSQNFAQQNAVLKAGISKVDITPTENLYMGGYDSSCREGKSDGADGNIYVRSLVFDDGDSRVAFIEIDVVSLPGKDYSAIRQLVSDKTGIPFENIMLGCVHNHAAPYPGKPNDGTKWYENFRSNIVKAAEDAVADLEPVKIGGGFGTSHIAMNRRKKMDDVVSYLTFDENNSSQSYGKYKTNNPVKIREIAGVYRLGANPGGSIDDKVGIMRIDKLSGQPKAVLINYACHGTSLGGRNNKISPEWNGYMLQYMEKEVPGITGIFIQGAAGDINPRFVGGLDGYKDNLKSTANLGYEIGEEVLKVFNTITTKYAIDPQIKIIHDSIVCPLKYDYVVRNFRNTTVDVPTTAIKLDEFEWVTFPGEAFHAIGQVVKASTHARYPFFFGYCNGSLGYLPTQKAFSEGGYEPWTSRFAPVTEKVFEHGVEKILIGLQ